MELKDAYRKIRGSVVAIASRWTSDGKTPEIFGTGFVIDSEGIILTNNHVVQAIKKIPRPKHTPKNQWPVKVIYFDLRDDGMATLHMEVAGVATLGRVAPAEGYYYGEQIPDLGFIEVKVTGLPALEIEDKFSKVEGEEVAFAGFPMGTRTLKAPGWIHQISPTLHTGKIASICPFTCENPHAVLINAMTQGGASGSPVFDPQTGKVLGIIYAGLNDVNQVDIVDSDKKTVGAVVTPQNTCLSLAISSNVIHSVHGLLKETKEFKERETSGFKLLKELLEEEPTIAVDRY